MNTIGTLWPSVPTMLGWLNAARMINPTRVRVSSSSSAMNTTTEMNSMKMRNAG